MKHSAHSTGPSKPKFGNRCVFRDKCFHLRTNLRQGSSELIKLVACSCFQKCDIVFLGLLQPVNLLLCICNYINSYLTSLSLSDTSCSQLFITERFTDICNGFRSTVHSLSSSGWFMLKLHDDVSAKLPTQEKTNKFATPVLYYIR